MLRCIGPCRRLLEQSDRGRLPHGLHEILRNHALRIWRLSAARHVLAAVVDEDVLRRRIQMTFIDFVIILHEHNSFLAIAAVRVRIN